jgi:5,10-methylenetetrahydromethanopterin reductase
MGTKIWMIVFPIAGQSIGTARWVEDSGLDGWAVADTQNLAGDPYSALSLAAHATSRIGLGTGITNATTRHPAVTASAITTVQVESGGRAVLGIGRGDSSLAYIGQKAASLSQFKTYLQQVQGFLGGENVSLDGYSSQMAWVTRTSLPKVPVDVAATGPRVIALGAQLADWVTFSVGAQPDRLRWAIETAHQARLNADLDPAGISLGAYVNVVVHPDRDKARDLGRGWVSSFARFSGMEKGSALESLAPEGRSVIEQVSEQYNMSYHGHQEGEHTSALTNDFIDSFAIAGPPAYCIERLQELIDLKLERLVIVGPGRGADRFEIKESMQRFTREVLPFLKR